MKAIRAVLLVVVAVVAFSAGQRFARGGGRSVVQAGAQPAAAAAVQAAPLSVLMIGNSHSAPIPGLLTKMAMDAGVPLYVTGLTPGGRTLAQHLAAPETAQALHARHYDIVTLQDQGQVASYAESVRAQRLYPAGEALARVVRGVGAEPWLYAVYARPPGDPDNFPGDTYEAMQQRSDEGYAALAARIQASVVPVGRAFRNAHALRPELPLWNADGIHASPQGFYLAAAVFFAALLKHDPTNLAFTADLPAEDAAFLRRTAQSAVE